MLSDSAAGIAPDSAPGFVLAEIMGVLLDWRLIGRCLIGTRRTKSFRQIAVH
jgi:hypothetical protein